ncbi:Rv1355c family protein [Nocardia stercoris]|uniref:Rv1355c family protein n=1 Tax=Nocardia stercoris TaxID=2483361 RepID=A0A3M2LE10_9NOCA|nr:Rv1355c family protein [Nocardia stercoris]RMI34843.1 Rv1355c family protein [Nocardia stercoris]
MTAESVPEQQYRPVLLDPADAADAATLAELRDTPGIDVRDLRAELRIERDGLLDAPDLGETAADDRWAYYPWRNALVGVPGPRTMRTIRLDRNRNKLSQAEQERLGTQVIGVVGQSVGHAIAYTLAQEGTCAELRLADFDELELANLNRVPAGLFDLGLNKAVVTARRIAELDPYFPVVVYPAGITDDNIDEFFTGLTAVVEECDSMDIKLAVREAAQQYAIPLLMETSDRGLLDIERYDLEPGRPLFHGLLNGATRADLRGLSTRDKAPYVARILDPAGMSVDFAAGLVEVDQTLSSWPQLGGDVQLGGASVAAAIRRLGLGRRLPSGRTRVDLEQCLDAVAEPPLVADLDWSAAAAEDRPVVANDADTPAEAVVACALRAPSGGNVQPWKITATDDEVRIDLDPAASTAMDVELRGSAVAVGAALYNARIAAAARGVLGDAEYVETPGGLTATLRLTPGTDPELAGLYPGALARHTNRRLFDGEPIGADVLDALAAAAAEQGGLVHAVTDRASIATAAELLGASDRIRYLDANLHAEMFAELRWPGDDLRTGLDLRTLELKPDELAKFGIGKRADVMARLRELDAGVALGEYTVDRVVSSSAVLAVTVVPAGPEPDLRDYARAGAALERLWIEAGERGLAVQPVSPVFLYARHKVEAHAVSPGFADTLTSIQNRFLDLLAVPEHEIIALVLRLGHATTASVRSRRLPT